MRHFNIRIKECIKATVFAVLFVLILSFVTRIFAVSTSNREYQWMSGLYDEPKNSLDAVYIGSSNCYAFWNQNLAFQNYGINVYPFTCSSQPLIVAEYLIKEARKTQPNAVFVVNINTLGEEVKDIVMHRVLDFLPLSKNKLQLTDYLCDLSNLTFSERLEYYIPIIRYHQYSVTAEGFTSKKNDIKGGNIFSWYLGDSIDNSNNYKTSFETADISKPLEKSINSLLDYCDKENVKIVFVTVPRAENDIEDVKKLNTVNKIVSDRGYPVVDLLNNNQDINIDTKTDYYDNEHTNIHGSIKFTKYISEYLIENYGFKDKRQNKGFSSWSKAYKSYSDIVSSYALDFELNFGKCDYSLSAPRNISIIYTENSCELSWQNTENADGYAIYRKTNEGKWEKIYDTVLLKFVDKDITQNNLYSYTVVPYLIQNGERFYGKYLYNGISVKAAEE